MYDTEFSTLKNHDEEEEIETEEEDLDEEGTADDFEEE